MATQLASYTLLTQDGAARAPLTNIPGLLSLQFSTKKSTSHPPLPEPLVAGNLVNRFFTLPGPHARTPFPFDHVSAVSPNDMREQLRACSLEELYRGFLLESGAPTPYDKGQDVHRAPWPHGQEMLAFSGPSRESHLGIEV